MNLKKGMRRVALLLGMAGAVWGGFRCYVKVQSMLPATLNNQRFRQDANREQVQRTIRAAKAHDMAQPVQLDGSTLQPISPPNPRAIAPQTDPKTGERIPPAKAPWDRWKQYEVSPQPEEWEAGITASYSILTPADTKCHAILGQPTAYDSGKAEPPLLVCWDKNYKVVSFEDVEHDMPFELEEAASGWQYCWCAFLPILGFFVPWVAVRLIAWALAGFAASPVG